MAGGFYGWPPIPVHLDDELLAPPTPATFVAIRFPGIGVVLSRHTLAVPGSQADLGVLGAAVDAEGRQFTVLAALRGFTADQAEALREDPAATYGRAAEILRRAPGEILLRFAWAMRDLQSPFLRALARIQGAFGQVWTHVEAGRLTLYAPVRSARAEAAIGRVRANLAGIGLPAEVDAVRLPPAELAAFERMQVLLAEVLAADAPALA
jgi:hypothetical protein